MSRAITIVSFGHMHTGSSVHHGTQLTVPQADIGLDVRRLVPALTNTALENLTGLDEPVQKLVLAGPEARSLAIQTALSAHALMDDNDLQQLTIAVGSTEGRHRSVVIARHIQTKLDELNIAGLYTLGVAHRDVHRPGQHR